MRSELNPRPFCGHETTIDEIAVRLALPSGAVVPNSNKATVVRLDKMSWARFRAVLTYLEAWMKLHV
jgi:hypothetical protein